MIKVFISLAILKICLADNKTANTQERMLLSAVLFKGDINSVLYGLRKKQITLFLSLGKEILFDKYFRYNFGSMELFVVHSEFDESEQVSTSDNFISEKSIIDVFEAEKAPFRISSENRFDIEDDEMDSELTYPVKVDLATNFHIELNSYLVKIKKEKKDWSTIVLFEYPKLESEIKGAYKLSKSNHFDLSKSSISFKFDTFELKGVCFEEVKAIEKDIWEKVLKSVDAFKLEARSPKESKAQKDSKPYSKPSQQPSKNTSKEEADNKNHKNKENDSDNKKKDGTNSERSNRDNSISRDPYYTSPGPSTPTETEEALRDKDKNSNSLLILCLFVGGVIAAIVIVRRYASNKAKKYVVSRNKKRK